MNFNSLKDININQKIEIIDGDITYTSMIQDLNKNGLYITYPFCNTKPLITHLGSVIEFYITTDKDIIKYKSIVLGKKREQNIDLLILSLPEVLERVQRREYFRLPITMPIKYFGLPKGKSYTSLKDVPAGYFSKLISSVSIDLSGGGIKIITNEFYSTGDFLIVSFNIPQEVNVLCSVVRVENSEDKNKYKTALKYEEIDENIRDKIIQFIFNKLREQSKLLR